MFARWGSYHGNSLGALDLSGRKPLRRPYEGWLGRFRHVSAAYPYRAGEPGSNALGDADELAEELERAFVVAGPGTVAAFVAEPIVGATLAAAVPPEGYWPAITEVCRRHGVLLIADEVMTGFGRSGRWFGLDHWGVRPDILVAAKGATSGYWPFGFVAASGEIHDAVVGAGGFTHGFTFSHHVVGAAVAREVLRILESENLVADQRDEGRAPPGPPPRPASATTRASARSGGAGSWSVSSSWRIAPRAPPSRGRRRSPRPLSAWRSRTASCSTPAPASPTGRTATRSSSGRRS